MSTRLANGSPTPAPVVSVRRLSKHYAGKPVVDGVDMQVVAGECWGLLGPNGAGKTTFLRMITGGTPPSGGDLEVLGYPVPESATAMRRHIGIVPQTDNLDPDFTVLENLRSYASFFGLQAVQTEAIAWGEGLGGLHGVRSRGAWSYRSPVGGGGVDEGETPESGVALGTVVGSTGNGLRLPSGK